MSVMSRTEWLAGALIVAAIVAIIIIFSQTAPPPVNKAEFLNKTAQELNPTKLALDYCSKHQWEKFCETKVSSHIPEFRHYHTDPIPETPRTFPIPGPCNMLCVVWDSETDVKVTNRESEPVTVLVVTVSLHDGSADPIPVWLEVMDPGQTVPVRLQYANGSHMGIIIYQN